MREFILNQVEEFHPQLAGMTSCFGPVRRQVDRAASKLGLDPATHLPGHREGVGMRNIRATEDKTDHVRNLIEKGSVGRHALAPDDIHETGQLSG
ncbi:hypothetical protein [Staphylococcus aureus]|uniref:hypothetical protein n=1 Tax=Staphylococcus aureus TaxID=1280 RepID=UPI001FD536AA|nr:hypothetical protein [Staphylococcus aureus]MCJ8032896.1 hypothetical protein [Staphylococcus aureus]